MNEKAVTDFPIVKAIERLPDNESLYFVGAIDNDCGCPINESTYIETDDLKALVKGMNNSEAFDPTKTIYPSDMFHRPPRMVAARELMFEKYIHTCQCSDENGWFAFFQPNGEYDEEMFAYRSTGYGTEEEAIAALIRAACDDIRMVEAAK